MRRPTSKPSDIDRFLTTVSPERKIVLFHNKQIIFSQGERGDSVFHIEDRSVKLTATSELGKEAIVGILERGDLFGAKVVSRQINPSDFCRTAPTQ